MAPACRPVRADPRRGAPGGGADAGGCQVSLRGLRGRGGEPGTGRRLFFFQAEDGIRDHCVTGVQTCALPIYKGGDTDEKEREQMVGRKRGRSAKGGGRPKAQSKRAKTTKTSASKKKKTAADKRSEERRVGKECRARWGP